MITVGKTFIIQCDYGWFAYLEDEDALLPVDKIPPTQYELDQAGVQIGLDHGLYYKSKEIAEAAVKAYRAR